MNNRVALIQKCLIVLLATAAIPAAAMEIDYTRNRANQFIALSGEMDIETADDLDQIVAKKLSLKPTVIIIESGGGDLESVDFIKDSIIDAAKKHNEKFKKKLLILINNHCLSSCTILAAALQNSKEAYLYRLLVSGDTDFGFHGPLVKNETTGDISIIKDKKEFNMRKEEMLAAYINNGVSRNWIYKNIGLFQRNLMKTYSAKQICYGTSNILKSGSCIEDMATAFKFIDRFFSTRASNSLGSK